MAENSGKAGNTPAWIAAIAAIITCLVGLATFLKNELKVDIVILGGFFYCSPSASFASNYCCRGTSWARSSRFSSDDIQSLRHYRMGSRRPSLTQPAAISP